MNFTRLGFQPLDYYSALQASRAVTATFIYNQNLLTGSRNSRQLNIIQSPDPKHPLPPNFPQICKGDVLNNRHIVMELIGSGGIGIVVRAYDQVQRKEVAIKFNSIDHIKMLEAEIQDTRRLSDSIPKVNVPKVHDEGIHGENRFGVFEFIEGRTLYEEIHGRGKDDLQRKISLPDALKIISELASVLMVAESQGIVHRDIKPENVILRKDNGEAVLIDWGLAKATPKNGMVFGTPTYLPPETLCGEDAGHGTDIYALGIMLWEMLNGRVPFDENLKGFYQIIHQLEVKNNGLPAIGQMPAYKAFYNQTYALVNSLTTPYSRFRIQTAAELKQRVDELRVEIENAKIEIEKFEKELDDLHLEPHIPNTTGSITILTPVIGVDIPPAQSP